MNLSDEQLQLIHSAMERYGTTGLARELGLSRHSLYRAIQRKSGLNHITLQAIQQLMLSKAREMPGNGPSAALEATQEQTRSDTAVERQLIAEWTLGLSKDELMKVIAFIAEIKANRPANS